jgi:hypothetical protein
MRTGQQVRFRIYDTLFKDVIEGAGVLVRRVYCRLWLIKPEGHERLSGGNVQVHENNIIK